MKRSLFILGAGVLIGILIAPEKGSDLRERLSIIVDDLLEAIKDFTDSRVDEFPVSEETSSL